MLLTCFLHRIFVFRLWDRSVSFVFCFLSFFCSPSSLYCRWFCLRSQETRGFVVEWRRRLICSGDEITTAADIHSALPQSGRSISKQSKNPFFFRPSGLESVGFCAVRENDSVLRHAFRRGNCDGFALYIQYTYMHQECAQTLFVIRAHSTLVCPCCCILPCRYLLPDLQMDS